MQPGLPMRDARGLVVVLSSAVSQLGGDGLKHTGSRCQARALIAPRLAATGGFYFYGKVQRFPWLAHLSELPGQWASPPPCSAHLLGP